ncbi:Transport and Golgi organization protein 1 [Manis javanica]|nr:Transport and Golgi organization protein 1 [Manis javanica]
MQAGTLLFWLLLLGCLSHSNRNVVSILPDTFHLRLDVSTILRKLIVGAATLGVSALVIYFWTAVLMIKPQIYQEGLEVKNLGLVQIALDEASITEPKLNSEDQHVLKESVPFNIEKKQTNTQILSRVVIQQTREITHLKLRSIWMQEDLLLSQDHPACPARWAALHHHLSSMGHVLLLHPGVLTLHSPLHHLRLGQHHVLPSTLTHVEQPSEGCVLRRPWH